MVVCNLGGPDRERHIDEENVRVALGPDTCAIGSEAGHGYGWNTTKHCFALASRFPMPEPEIVLEDGDDAIRSGDTEVMAENSDGQLQAPSAEGDPIDDYEVPHNVDGVGGSQDSTARTTFSKVSYAFPAYILSGGIESDTSEEDALERHDDDAESSDRNWIPEYIDTVESSDDDFDIDIVDESMYSKEGLGDWCMTHESFAPVSMDMDQLAQHYIRNFGPH